jgi:hypothetical protein
MDRSCILADDDAAFETVGDLKLTIQRATGQERIPRNTSQPHSAMLARGVRSIGVYRGREEMPTHAHASTL